MKKLLAMLLVFSFSFSLAYTPTAKDIKTAAAFKTVIENIKTQDIEKYNKIKDTLSKLDISKMPDNKTTWLLWELKKVFLGTTTTQNTTITMTVEVIDGDTIKLNGETIRMIGIDAPESNTTRYGYVECYGVEATQHLKDLMKNAKEVKIEKDPTQGDKDKYDRTLGYVIADGVDINQKMIDDGYAFEYTYDKAYKNKSSYGIAQLMSSLDSKGLWSSSTCGGDRKKGTPDEKKTDTSTIVPSTPTTTYTNDSSDSRTYFTGPRGGCYYYNSKGNKSYVDRSYCR